MTGIEQLATAPETPDTATKGNTQRISPTDISQFIRLDQCKRYLALALLQRREGRGFMQAYGVNAQAIPPLLTRSGDRFEDQIEEGVKAHFTSFNFGAEPVKDEESSRREVDNARLAALLRAIQPGEIYVLFQVRLLVNLEGWEFRGDIDILRLELDKEGNLKILIADMKSSVRPRLEHRLQVAFYQDMVKKLLQEEEIEWASLDTAILYRGVAEATAGLSAEEAEKIEQHKAQALEYFGLENAFLELISAEDQDTYLRSVEDLVTGPEAVARQVATTELGEIPYHLDNKCSSCVFNEHCMKWSAEEDDLSLIPHITAQDKEALRRKGVTTTRQLAALKDLIKSEEKSQYYKLVAATGQESLARTLSTTWPVGPRVDELVHRARLYRKSAKMEEVTALENIPNKGHGSLPFTSPTHNPNLVRIYLDAQHDYLNDRLYLLGALVSACENGAELPERRRSIVHITDGPPDSLEKEAALLLAWIKDLLTALVEVAAPDPVTGERKAPIHLIFYNRSDQKILLDGLSRHLTTLFGATPLYDFITQLPAFDSPLVSYLDQEIRELKNYPMVCQSLQQVAEYLGFNWRQGYGGTGPSENYRDLFNERMFDYRGKLEQKPGSQQGAILNPESNTSESNSDKAEGNWEWYSSRARFNSEIPLEYAYAAWGKLALPGPKVKRDLFSLYRQVNNTDLLTRFQARRLEAIEHITRQFRGNHLTEKGSFTLPDLAAFEGKARNLAHALTEFVTIEHHVELGSWKTIRNLAPERRVLMGESFLVRYLEEDQSLEVAEQNRENIRRQCLREEYYTQFKETHPGEEPNPSQAESARWKWSQEGMRFRLRVDLDGVECELNEVMLLSNFKEGDRVVIYPRWTQDSRLSLEERTDNTPTPRQLLYGTRADIKKIIHEREEDSGRIVASLVELEMHASHGGKYMKGYSFDSKDRPFEPGIVYTIDSDPNNIYGYYSAVVTEGLRDLKENKIKGQNSLYSRLELSTAQPVTLNWSEKAREGQAHFLAGLVALKEKGALHDFEPGKQEYIGQHGATPVLLVQGPPGTGKSYSTGFAVFARLQGAMADGQPFKVLLSCKTHAATNVLLQNVRSVQEKLRKLKEAEPAIFGQYFDERLLTIPLYRLTPKENPGEGIIVLSKGDPFFKTLTKNDYSITGATPGAVYRLVKDRVSSSNRLFTLDFINCLVLDEASQMNLPEAGMAALPLHEKGQIIVVGDPRQMPPIVKHDWDSEPRRTFQEYKSYQSLYNAFLELPPSQRPPMIKFEESFRLHSAMADFLKQEVYHLDGINYHSRRNWQLPHFEHEDSFIRAVLAPEYPLVVVVHHEAASQTRNEYERQLVGPVLQTLADSACYNLNPKDGLGVVVPHRAQRAAIQENYPVLTELDEETGAIRLSAVDTVERFQGGERRVIIVSATESDGDYLLAAGDFLYDPRRLTVAISRAKEKLVLVASRSVFSLFSPNEKAFANAQLWKNLLRHTCTERLWQGERQGVAVEVWGNQTSKVEL